MSRAMADSYSERLNGCKNKQRKQNKQNRTKVDYYCYNNRIMSFDSPLRLWKESHGNASAVLKKEGAL